MKEQIKQKIREVQNFPINGVSFKDITPVLRDINLNSLGESICNELNGIDFDIILGVESRGFIFATIIGMVTNKPIAMIREPGKLPPPVSACTCTTEYSNITLEIQPGTGNALIVDDVLATGGTAIAAAKLAEQVGYTVAGGFYFIELTYLNPIINHNYISYIKY